MDFCERDRKIQEGGREKTVEEILEQSGLFIEDDTEMAQIDGMEQALIGLSEDDRLVYGYEKLVRVLTEKEGCSREEADDYVQYNIIRGIPYIKNAHKPIIVYEVKGGTYGIEN